MNNKDTIYRQAAIYAAKNLKVDEEEYFEYDVGFNDGISEVVKMLYSFPSAQPEPCEDAVSREAVLDKAYAYGNGLEPDGFCVDVEDIQALPPVTPKRMSSAEPETNGYQYGYNQGFIDGVKHEQEKTPAKPQRYMVTTAESTDLDILKGIITKPSDITIIPLPKAEPGWIPCSERLPERGVSVLLSHVGYVSEDYLDIDDGAMYFWNSGIDLNEELNNLAWMPLPKPWKGGDES